MSDDQRDDTSEAPTDGTATGPDRDGRARTGLPRWLRFILLAIVIAVAVVVLFTWVFPWVEEMTQDPTIGAQLLRSPR